VRRISASCVGQRLFGMDGESGSTTMPLLEALHFAHFLGLQFRRPWLRIARNAEGRRLGPWAMAKTRLRSRVSIAAEMDRQVQRNGGRWRPCAQVHFGSASLRSGRGFSKGTSSKAKPLETSGPGLTMVIATTWVEMMAAPRSRARWAFAGSVGESNSPRNAGRTSWQRLHRQRRRPTAN